MKKLILVLPILSILLLAFVLPASAADIGNLTNESSYCNPDDPMTFNVNLLDAYTYIFNSLDLNSPPICSLISIDNPTTFYNLQALCVNIGGGQNIGNVSSLTILAALTPGDFCGGSSYNDCLTGIDGFDYYSNAIDTPSSGSCLLPILPAVFTATSSLTTIMTSAINSVVGLALEVFNYWWPFVLVIGIIVALVGVFSRFALIGIRKAGRKK